MKEKNSIVSKTVSRTDIEGKNFEKKEAVTPDIESMIMTIRGCHVMLDRDLATLYGVETKALNQAVKRNEGRFPNHFRFQLTQNETLELVTNCDRFKSLKHASTSPFAFSEQGVAMLSTVLRGKTAVTVSIQIIDAFVAMRHVIARTINVMNRIEILESNQLMMLNRQLGTEHLLEEVFQRLDKEYSLPIEGVFYDGQIFDAFKFASDLIRSAKERIILIDNYIDESTLLTLTKRREGVTATVITRHISETLAHDLERHNRQYPPVEVCENNRYHDRFLIIDCTVYHLGASLKDLGKKLFAFSRMEVPAEEILSNG